MTWKTAAKEYKSLIKNPEYDSQYLRQRGLVSNIVEMVGDCENSVLLDAGTATCWLFNFVKPKEAHACDINVPEEVPDGVIFENQDVHWSSELRFS